MKLSSSPQSMCDSAVLYQGLNRLFQYEIWKKKIYPFCVCVCNKVLLKYKGDREASDIGIRRGQKEYPPASLQLDVI